MKTKNIFLMALAFALLLTSACDKNEIVNTENTADKGYALPVTINVSRLGDNPATRATFNDGTKKLAFSTGDKLFVEGSWHEGDYDFAGTLTWVSGGTFSGTITTQTEWTGTVDELLSQDGGASATLLPAGYESYGFLSIEDSGYNAYLSENFNNAFATSKASGVEQLSYEYCYNNYSSGFTLTPCNAILNFTITGLSASTEVAVVFSYSTTTVNKNVTTDGSGNATFAIGLSYGEDLNNCTLTVGGNAITLVNSSKVLEAGKIYNIARSALILNPAVGQVIGDDGKNYAAGSLPSGVTAVAKIVYVGSDNGEAAPYNHGLALAMSDAGSWLQWSTSTSDAGHTKQADSNNFTSESGLQYNATHNSDTYPAFKAAIANNSTATPTGCSAWFLASGYQWAKMIASYGLANLNTTANGYTGLKLGYYWSSSERSAYSAWAFRSVNGAWSSNSKTYDPLVRSCLAF